MTHIVLKRVKIVDERFGINIYINMTILSQIH